MIVSCVYKVGPRKLFFSILSHSPNLCFSKSKLINAQMCIWRMFDYTILNPLFETVQTFNSCTSRPDVCLCPVVQTPINSMSKSYVEHINDPCSLQIKDTFSSEVIHTPMPTKLGGSRARSLLSPDCPHI